MASPAQRQYCDVSKELMNAIAKDNWTEVKEILSENSRHVADSLVTQLISEDQWHAVRQIIECVRDEDRAWNIKGIIVKSSILLSVADRDWTCTRESPNKRFPDSTFQWIIQQACKRATESDVVQFVLPHCADDRLDSVLTILVERRQWQAVGEVLVRGVSDSTKQWAVHETCEHCKNEDLRTHIRKILPHCAPDQEECVLTTLVKRSHCKQNDLAPFYCRWNFRSQSYLWNQFPVDQLLVQDILPHCAYDQLGSVLTTLVERRLWQAVLYVLTRGISDSSKRWVVLEVCASCESVVREQILFKIVRFCAHDQADCLLTTLVERRQWRAVEKMLKKGVSDSNRQWALQEACTHCREYDLRLLVQIILRHCADDQMDSVLTTLMTRRMWRAVLYMLRRGVSNSSKRWLVLEMCACCESVEEYASSEILLFCADDQVDCVLTTLVDRRLWRAVGEMLKKGVSDSNKQWAVQEACTKCKDDELDTLIEDILPHCTVDQLDCVLTTLVERRQWEAAGEMLKKGVSDSNKQWAVREACEHCKECDLGTGYTRCHFYSTMEQWLVHEILRHCAYDQLDSVLTTLIQRRRWWAVAEVLKKGVNDKQRVIQEACKHCTDDDLGSLIHNLLPHCANNQLDSVLTTLVERRLWKAVLYVLKRGVSDSSKRWVVLEVCACCESVVKQDISSEIVHFCADDQAESILTTLVEQRQWSAVGEMLKKGVSDSDKQWAVQEACKKCTDNDLDTLMQDILPYCTEDQLDSMLTTLVGRRLWQAVLHVLKRGVSDSSKRWVMLEVCACCESVVKQDISSEIFHFCADDQLDCVLTTLVERRLWRAVGEMLKKGVSDPNKQWAVQEACYYCKEYDFGTRWRFDSHMDLVDEILPHCTDDQLDCVLTILVERRLWWAVEQMLKKDVSDSNKQWAVQEACKHYGRYELEPLIQNILPHCAVDQLVSVLTTLVERRLWQAVGVVLEKKDVSDSYKQWAVQEACKHCNKCDFETDFIFWDCDLPVEQFLVDVILPHCTDDQLDCVLTTLVESRLWQAVGKMLKKGVSDSNKQWAVREACKYCRF